MPESIGEIIQLVEDQAQYAYNHSIGPKPGAANVLRRLKEAGIPMYIATNTRRDLVEDGLRRNGLLSYFGPKTSNIFSAPITGGIVSNNIAKTAATAENRTIHFGSLP